MERALAMETRIRSGLAGLTKKSAAPARMAPTTVSMPPVAVTTITGWAKPRVRMSARVSWPVIPGITRSSSTTSIGAPDPSCSSAWRPPSACSTAKPSRSSTAWISRR